MFNPNIIDVSQLDLYWNIEEGIIYNKDSDSFSDYLELEKKKLDQPRSKIQKSIAGIIILGSFIISINFFNSFITRVIQIFRGTYEINYSTNVFHKLGFPEGVIPTISLGFSFGGCLITVIFGMYFFYLFFLTKEEWSKYHDQMLSLFGRLKETNSVDAYIVFEEGENRFLLRSISLNWDIEWIYPFLFSTFPPLIFYFVFLLALSSVSILMVISIIGMSLLLTSLNEFLVFFGLIAFTLIILFSIGSLIKLTYTEWKPYNFVRTSLLDKQKEAIHYLILTKTNDSRILWNQNNLTRIRSIKIFPIPLLIRLSIPTSILGSIITYFIALFA